MATSLDVYLYHHVAKVCLELENYSKASAAFDVIISKTLEAIETSLQEDMVNLQMFDFTILEHYAQFCELPEFVQQRQEMYEKLISYSSAEGLDIASSLKLKLLSINFFDNSDEPALFAAFEDVIKTAVADSGESSDLVQSIYVSFVKHLKQKGATKKLSDTVRSRLQQLMPGYDRVLALDATTENHLSFNKRLIGRLTRNTKKMKAAATHFLLANKAHNRGDHDEAMRQHTFGAQAKNVECEFSLGTFYQLGIGCSVDMGLARKHYLQAAERGHPNAQHHLAALLQMGLGGEVDIEGAFKWYQKAAQQDFIPALNNLAAVYVSGLLGKPMYAAGIRIYLKATLLGDEASWTKLLAHFSNIHAHA